MAHDFTDQKLKFGELQKFKYGKGELHSKPAPQPPR